MPPKRKTTKQAAAKERPAQKARRDTQNEDPAVDVPQPVDAPSAAGVVPGENAQADTTTSAPSKTKKMIANIKKLHDPNDEECVETALKELYDGHFEYKCHDEPDWTETFVSAIGAGIFPGILVAMTNFPDSEGIVECCLRILVQLAYEPPDAKWLGILIDLDAIGKVLRCMIKFQDKANTIASGLRFLLNAAVYIKKAALAQVKEVDGSIELLIQTMDSHRDNEDNQQISCRLIYRMILEDKDNKYDMQSKLKKAKAMSKVVQAMEIHAENPDVQQQGKAAMKALLG